MSYFKIYKIDAISSTNDYLKQLYLKKNIYDNFLIITNNQTEGKGQGSSYWESEPKKNLTLSIYKDLKKNKLKNPFIINLIISISIIETLKKYNLPNLKIKWPNDILSASKKISGILIENFFQREFLISSIIGIGLNVNTHTRQFPKSIAKYSISLQSIKGEQIRIHELAAKLIKAILSGYKDCMSKSLEKELISGWAEVDELSGKKIKVHCGKEIFSGKASGIDKDGNLLLKLRNGRLRKIHGGEIEIL